MEFGGIAARTAAPVQPERGVRTRRGATNVCHAKELGFSVSVFGLIIVSSVLFGKRVVVGGVKKIASLLTAVRACLHV